MSGSRPRIFCIPAREAPVLAVLRRGPTDWWHIGRWDLTVPAYEPGAWFHGALYPQKCDLSPDGRWLAYSAMKVGAEWAAGDTYEAISRLPWLMALAAWEAGTTYTRGMHFADQPGESEFGRPDVGDAKPCLRRYGIVLNRPVQYAVERRRGWSATSDSPSRESGGPWDELRRVSMEKPRPGDPGTSLLVSGSYAAFRDIPERRDPAIYAVTGGGDLEMLRDVQWADWDRAGRLLVATSEGALQIRPETPEGVIWEHDLSSVRPEPCPPPQWANEW